MNALKPRTARSESSGRPVHPMRMRGFFYPTLFAILVVALAGLALATALRPTLPLAAFPLTVPTAPATRPGL